MLRSPCAASILILVGVAWADTLHVPADYATIQAAIDAAASGDTVLVAPGHYAERIECLQKAIHIRSSAGADATTIDASGLGAGSVVTLIGMPRQGSFQGFTVTGGADADGAGLHLSGGAPLIADCVLTGNHAGEGIGGGAIAFGADSRFERCVFRDNSASLGGAVHVYTHPEFIDCRFEDNHAEHTGGVYTLLSQAHFDGCTFRRNSCDEGGSALTMHTPISVTVADSLFCGQAEPQILGAWHDLGGNTIVDECPACAGDFNGDGSLDTLDVLAFLNAWASDDAGADFNGDGSIDTLDVLAFLNAWAGGC